MSVMEAEEGGTQPDDDLDDPALDTMSDDSGLNALPSDNQMEGGLDELEVGMASE